MKLTRLGKKPKTAAQKAAALRNIKKAQEARDKAIVSEVEKRAKAGKAINGLSKGQKAVAVAAGLATLPLGGVGGSIAANVMRSNNSNRIIASYKRVAPKKIKQFTDRDYIIKF